MATHMITLAMLFATGLAAEAPPAITPLATILRPRAIDPELVGYISESGSYGASRTCNYPQIVSTSAGYVQCCDPASDSSSTACQFFTACSNNVLIAADTSVPCFAEPRLTCNTALVLPTAGAMQEGSYLACWQTSLGDQPFTFVQMTGAASAVASSSAAASSASSSAAPTSAVNQSNSASGSSSAVSAASSASLSSSSKGAAATMHPIVNGGVFGGLAVVAHALL